jgi:hypothetical protein
MPEDEEEKCVGDDAKAVAEYIYHAFSSLEARLQQERNSVDLAHSVPDVDPDIELVNDNTPAISRIQIDLLVNAMANDMTRVASLQFMRVLWARRG